MKESAASGSPEPVGFGGREWRGLAMGMLSRWTVLALLVTGCDVSLAPTLETERPPPTGTEVAGDLDFFCKWSTHEEAFQIAAEDYAKGNRRMGDAWTTINSKGLPGKTPEDQESCWEGALLYLGVFGDRTQLNQLIQLSIRDPMLENETYDPNEMTGVTSVGRSRGFTLSSVYLALASQVRRQLIFDGHLDPSAQTAEGLIQQCALDHFRCIEGSGIRDYTRQRIQRGAIRGLLVSGTSSSLESFEMVKTTLAGTTPTMPYTIAIASKLGRTLDERASLIKVYIPAP